MSSYLAVHEIFKGKPLPNKSSYSFRDMPDTPVVSVLKFRTMFSNIKIFSQSVFIYLYEATVVHLVRSRHKHIRKLWPVLPHVRRGLWFFAEMQLLRFCAYFKHPHVEAVQFRSTTNESEESTSVVAACACVFRFFTLLYCFSHFQDLFDRLVVLNSDPKIHALFNFEQSHSYGLR